MTPQPIRIRGVNAEEGTALEFRVFARKTDFGYTLYVNDTPDGNFGSLDDLIDDLKLTVEAQLRQTAGAEA